MATGFKTGGRTKGVVNKATKEARQAIALFVDNNAHRLQEWLDEIAGENPEKAFILFQSLIEYHIPKLARTELTGGSINPLIINVIKFAGDNAPQQLEAPDISA